MLDLAVGALNLCPEGFPWRGGWGVSRQMREKGVGVKEVTNGIILRNCKIQDGAPK